ncbi:hypothetical protein VNO78_22900 [Psophocarpus tetragonolobus]|uniref:Uncharacterized protein n=1 Tax=Psophocarpus tetragonolobus TaxID=3891 RepID=A0AAN9XCW4_PSOTE
MEKIWTEDIKGKPLSSDLLSLQHGNSMSSSQSESLEAGVEYISSYLQAECFRKIAIRRFRLPLNSLKVVFDIGSWNLRSICQMHFVCNLHDDLMRLIPPSILFYLTELIFRMRYDYGKIVCYLKPT